MERLGRRDRPAAQHSIAVVEDGRLARRDSIFGSIEDKAPVDKGSRHRTRQAAHLRLREPGQRTVPGEQDGWGDFMVIDLHGWVEQVEQIESGAYCPWAGAG